MNVTCIPASPEVLDQALSVAGHAWLVKEWGAWIAGAGVYKAFQWADAVTNLQELVDAFNAVEKQLAEAENDVHIQQHLPAFLKLCKDRLARVDEKLSQIQITCAQSSRLAHLVTPGSQVATDIRNERGKLDKIGSELKRSTVRARHIARSDNGPLSPDEQIAAVKDMQSPTLPSLSTRPLVKSWNTISATLSPFAVWAHRITSIVDLQDASAQPMSLDDMVAEVQAAQGSAASNDLANSLIPRCDSPMSTSSDPQASADTIRARALRRDMVAQLKRMEDITARATI